MFRKKLFIIIILYVFLGLPITIGSIHSEYIKQKNAALAEIYGKAIVELSQEWNAELGPMMTDKIGCVFTDVIGDNRPELFLIGQYYSDTEILFYTIEDQSAVLKDRIDFSGIESDGRFSVARDGGSEEVFLINRWSNPVNSTDYWEEWIIEDGFTETRTISAELYEGEVERVYRYFDKKQRIGFFAGQQEHDLSSSDRIAATILGS